MSCCGKSTTTISEISSRFAAPRAITNYSPPLIAHFRCIGPSTVTAVGAATGRVYRFPSSGIAVQVDARDAASLVRVRQIELYNRHRNSKTT